MTINLKTLPPIVPGTDYARTLQGDTPADVAATGFLNTDTLSATISPGQGLPATLTVTPTWANATLCQFILTIPNAQSSSLSIDVPWYYGLVTATRAGSPNTVWPVAAFYLPTLPIPGTQAAATPPDLVAIPYAAQFLAQLSLNEPQWESIPTLITATSDAVRSFCMRRFDQGTVTEELPVVSGQIRLSRPPVNWVQRIQASPQSALYPSNGTADAAWIYAVITGDLAGGETITGLSLNWETAGAAQFSTITFSTLADQRISTLAAAITAVGSGWSATADSVLGDWPISELFDLAEGKGCGPNDQPSGTSYRVYSRNLTAYRPLADDGELTGMYEVGRIWGADDAMRWGPGGEQLFGEGYGIGDGMGRVKVTYNGGFATIPRDLQLACVELVKYQLMRLKAPLILKSETAGKYSYTINDQVLDALPPWVRQALSLHRISNA